MKITNEDYLDSLELDIKVSRLALMVLRDQMRADEDDAWSTFCYLKSFIQEEKIEDRIATKIITNMMKSYFDFDVTTHRNYAKHLK